MFSKVRRYRGNPALLGWTPAHLYLSFPGSFPPPGKLSPQGRDAPRAVCPTLLQLLRTPGGADRGRDPATAHRPAHHGEAQLLGDLPVVLIPLLHLALPGRQVAADEAEAAAVELEADGHGALVPRLPSHARLHCVHRHVPGTESAHAVGGLPSASEGKADAVLLQRRATWWQLGAGGSENPPTPSARRLPPPGTRPHGDPRHRPLHVTPSLPRLGAAPWGRQEYPLCGPSSVRSCSHKHPRSTLELNHLPYHLLLVSQIQQKQPPYPTQLLQEGPSDNQRTFKKQEPSSYLCWTGGGGWPPSTGLLVLRC